MKKLLLYNIKCKENVGSIYRLAMQYGIDVIYHYQSANPGRTDTYKAEKHINTLELTNTSLLNLFDNCFEYKIALETSGTFLSFYDYEEIAINDGYLLVVGNESYGLPDDIISRCDRVVTINAPKFLSYNVSHALAIALHGLEYRVVVG